MESSMIHFMIFLTHILLNTISLISLSYILTSKFSFFTPPARIIIPAAFSEIIPFTLFTIFLPQYVSLSNKYFLVVCNFCITILYISVLYCFILYWKRRQKIFLPVSLHTTFLIPLSQFVLMSSTHYILLFKKLGVKSELFPQILLIAGTLLVIPADIQLYRVIRANSEKERLAAQLEVMKQQAQRELEYYDSVNEKILETRKIRHDFQNQLQTAYQVFLSGSADSREQAVRLLHQLKLRIDEAAPSYFCPNMIVNAVLAEKSRKAKLENIAFETDVQLPADISIEEVDLCSVFANLLDNAIQAAAKAPNEKTVSVRSWVRAGYCIVKVTNSLGQGAEDLPENTRRRKKESSAHGYGLLILDSIAKRYHGELTTNKSSTLFDVTIQLRLQEIPRTDCA